MKFLFIYLQLILSSPDLDTFINNFSAKEYVVVNKFHQLPTRFKSSMKELRSLKFVQLSNYNSTDFNNKLLVNNDSRRGSIYFAYSENSAIIYYMHGGRGVHEHVYILGIDDRKKIWHKNVLPIKHQNLPELREVLKNKDYTESNKDDI